jgi:hypothetical protein
MVVMTVVAAMGVEISGCSDSTGIPALTTDPFLTVTLNVRGATMSTSAPYNTLQLATTARSASGAILTDSLETTFVTQDANLSVSSNGLVTALKTTPWTWVAARVRDLRSGVTHTDTVFIMVTSTTPSSPLATFAIQRPPGDSAKIGVWDPTSGLFTDTVVVAATAEDGTPIAPMVAFSVSDSTIARVDPQFGIVQGVARGEVIVRATTTYYGTTKTDSIRLTIANPVVAVVSTPIRASSTVAGQYVREFVPSTITIGVGGTVLFLQGITFDGPELSMDVIFDEPDAPQPSPIPGYVLFYPTGTGDIGPIPPFIVSGQLNPDCFVDFFGCQGASRSFPVAGT